MKIQFNPPFKTYVDLNSVNKMGSDCFERVFTPFRFVLLHLFRFRFGKEKADMRKEVYLQGI